MTYDIDIHYAFQKDDYLRISNSSERIVGVDTETSGLDYLVDNLKVIQISHLQDVWVIKYEENCDYEWLEKLFISNDIVKIFHHATFDIGFLMNSNHKISVNNVVCTKISSKIINGIDYKHSLQNLLYEYLGISISKDQQLSDWGRSKLSDKQVIYAANDVIYLSRLWHELENRLIDTKKLEIAISCFNFIQNYLLLKNEGITNIFEY